MKDEKPIGHFLPASGPKLLFDNSSIKFENAGKIQISPSEIQFENQYVENTKKRYKSKLSQDIEKRIDDLESSGLKED